jgi:hypothetical protein
VSLLVNMPKSRLHGKAKLTYPELGETLFPEASLRIGGADYNFAAMAIYLGEGRPDRWAVLSRAGEMSKRLLCLRNLTVAHEDCA